MFTFFSGPAGSARVQCRALLLPLFSCLLLSSCGDSGGSGPAKSVVTSITVSPPSQTLVSLGATAQFSAQVKDQTGKTMTGVALSWSSSTPAVASVSSSGLGTAVSNGTSSIKATSGTVSGSASLTVQQEVAQVEVVAVADTLFALGATGALTATPKDAMGSAVSGKSATWSTSNALVATVGNDGTVTAIADGDVTITATVDGETGTLAMVVKQVATGVLITTEPDGAVAGVALTTQPVVELRDSEGGLTVNDNTTQVTAAIASGGGTLQGTATATAVGGVVAFTDLRVDGLVGDRTLTFSATDLTPATSAAFALARGPASKIIVSGGDNQTAPAATALPEPLSVKVADAFENGVEGVEVAWSVTSGTGTLATPTSTTDNDGLAANTHTLGRFAVVETIEVAAAGMSGSPLEFTLTATPNGTVSGTITLSDASLSPADAVSASDAMRTPEDKRATGAYGGFGGPLAGTARAKQKLMRRRPSAIQSTRAPLQFTPPVFSDEDSDEEYVPDELIVTFKSAPMLAPAVGSEAFASSATAQSVGTSIQAALTPHMEPLRAEVAGISGSLLAARIKVADPGTLRSLAEQLRADPKVASVERNGIVRTAEMSPTPPYSSPALPGAPPSAPAARPAAPPFSPPSIPNDPDYPWQAWHYAMIDLPEAWSFTTGSADVLVAVVDGGIRFDHPGIAGALTSDGYDFVSEAYDVNFCAGGSISNSGDGDGYDPDPTTPAEYARDQSNTCLMELKSSGGHGLHTAGTIGAVGNDGLGATGVNWTVRIRPVRVIGMKGGTWWDIAQGILYAAGLPADDGAGGTVQAATGARIVNLSVYGTTESAVVRDAAISATAAGALIVGCAGNLASASPNYPAAHPQILSVSAVGPDGDLAWYSSYGNTVDIAAPGGDSHDGDEEFLVWSLAWDFTTDTPLVDVLQGTSQAAPHVSGVAALLLAQEPSLTNEELRARLQDYAVDIGAPGRDNYYGWGLLNARNSLTQSHHPVHQLYARLIDANTGATVQTVFAEAGGSYTFSAVPDGEYFVYAGQDADGDLLIGVPNRRWGALGGSAAPTRVTVDGAGSYPATFSIGYPSEGQIEDNNYTSDADVLPVGGYLRATISDLPGDWDFTVIQIPTAGLYTIETGPWTGACGFTLEEDPILTLYDSHEDEIAEHDDIDTDADLYCARISMELTPGTYYARVGGFYTGRYTIAVKEGGD